MDAPGSTGTTSGEQMVAVDLTTNTLDRPLGIDTPRPEFAWRIASDLPALRLGACAIQVSSSARFDDDLVWDSGRVATDRPFGHLYDGDDLESCRRYWWRVRTWARADGHDEVAGDWSSPSWFETGVLDPSLWSASWIGGEAPDSAADDAVVYLRGTLPLDAEVTRARAYVSARGWYRFLVNGTDHTGHALVPRWTPFDSLVEYQTYDVTDSLRSGDNVLALAVADGRFRGALGLFGGRNQYGDRVSAFAQLEVDLADGRRVTTGTNATWHAGPGRITGSDPKFGERADQRIPDLDWLTDTAPPARFSPATVHAPPAGRLVAAEVAPVTVVAKLQATVSRAPSGGQIVDFGQNFAGVVRLRLRGPAGRSVQLTHGELLTPGGELETDNILLGNQRWYQRDTVVTGGGDEWFEPWFTIHGFRYVEVVGLDGDLDLADVEGVVLSSALSTTGTFDASDPRLVALYDNVTWSLRSNFGDTPTDCPTRERSGWTGDIQVFGPTGALMVDEQAYLRRYLRNLAHEQFPDGPVPLFIPSEQPAGATLARRMVRVMSRAAGWSDVAVLLPWTLYRYYGDRLVLERQYDSMRAWVDHMAARASGVGRGLPLRALWSRELRRHQRHILDNGFHFGEWLRPGDNVAATFATHVVRPPAAIATAYFAHSSSVLAQTAAVLGRREEAEKYAGLSSAVRRAWRAAFVGTDGRIGHDRQDDYVRALAFDLLLPEQRPGAVARLVASIEADGDHLSTGFLSTALLLRVLVDGGRPDVAVRLLLQTTPPSWLYQVEQGATTIWETWEGYHPDGRGKESHNHYALGAVAGWLVEGLAGLRPSGPGWRTFLVDPVVPPELDHASAGVLTPFGEARSAWHREGNRVHLDVTVPPGAEATVTLHEGTTTVGSGQHRFTRPGTPPGRSGPA